MDEATTERVLRAVEQVPAGRVVSYGDIGGIVGTGARHVGRIMKLWGHNVAWWRVTNRDGNLPADLLAQALPHWEAEGIEVKPNGHGCRMSDHRADLTQLAADYDSAVTDLPHPESP